MIVGIDLGTTNSLISIFRDGATVLIPNALGHFMTPSVVCLDADGSLLVGLAARERMLSHPEAAVASFKRWIGSDKTVRLGEHTLRAEELSALVLKSLKADAEAFLGEAVTEAVITVPAYFNEIQRRATKIAGDLAGLKVERLLSEPTAAGLAYGLQERLDDTTFLVFDLGGGTFDVSILEYFSGVVQVQASAGDAALGGEDFVTVLLNWIAEQLPANADHSIVHHNKIYWRLAEQAKRDLSEQESVTLTITHDNSLFTATLTRAEYERRCEPLLQRLRKPIERALSDARLDPGTLSEVVLVGGSSRMPMIRQLVARLFGRLPLRTINPDETIAHGAAIQAALKTRDSALEEIVLTDVMPYSLGIIANEEIDGRLFRNRFSPIIERNSPVPISRLRTYSATNHGQGQVILDIRQGESPVGYENTQLGTLNLTLPPRSGGLVPIEIRFSYDVNGLLEVEAQVPSTRLAARAVIQRTDQDMTEEDISLSLEKLKTLKIHPRERQENVYLIERAKRLYAGSLGDEREHIAKALMQFELSLDTQDDRLIRQWRREFQAFLDKFDRGFVL
ncbi:Hsp70 family protein [Duganella sp. FT80W]|uniref:Hsp70 family protein n=1 Tax=Duganella guangzhouensis TaxID=2666084 RepID=A0A6I2L3L2_9BURK|nr:molecular chaperone HscC [Duganella guangzhouensis]MRW92718.1 Hsp70 family protein [Duganella guangzhouensis]